MIIWQISLFVVIGVSRQESCKIESELFDPKSVRICNVRCERILYFNTDFVQNDDGFILPSSFQDFLKPVDSPPEDFDEGIMKRFLFDKCPNHNKINPLYPVDYVDNFFLIIEKESEAGQRIFKKKDDVIRYESISQEIEGLNKEISSSERRIDHYEIYQSVYENDSDRDDKESRYNDYSRDIFWEEIGLKRLQTSLKALKEALVPLREKLIKEFEGMTVLYLREKGFVPEEDLMARAAAAARILL